MLKQFVLARSFKREASKLKSSDTYNCLPIETRQLLYIDRLLFRQIQGRQENFWAPGQKET